jgi:hypothetical protein
MNLLRTTYAVAYFLIVAFSPACATITIEQAGDIIYPKYTSENVAEAKAKLNAWQRGIYRVCTSDRKADHWQGDLQKYPFATLPGSVTRSILVGSEQVQVLDQTGGFESLRANYILDVSCNEGKRDPAFAPKFEKSIRLEKSIYFDGNDIKLSSVIGTNAYVTILNYDPFTDGKVIPLPQAGGSKQIKVSGGHTWRFEGTVHLPKGLSKSEEVIIVVATRKPVKLPEQMTMEAFNWLLGTIPLTDRREAYLPYTVEKLE